MHNGFLKKLFTVMGNRATEASNYIAVNNKKYKELSKNIIEVEEKILSLIPERSRYLMCDYSDIKGEREALVLDLLYKQGLIDGIRLGNLFNSIWNKDILALKRFLK